MMKSNVKKMILAAAMAAFMVYAPAMAEEAEEIEDVVIEESFEAVENTEEGTVVETAVTVGIEVVESEAIETAEIPEQAAQEAEAAEAAVETEAMTEAETGAQSFVFENDEVVIRAQAAQELPENVEMQVRKLEEGSAEYEAAKQAAAANCGTDESADYQFYDVTFTVEGNEIELADGSVYVQAEFKTVQKNSTVEAQEVFHIDEAGVSDVTAETEEGGNMSSVSFAM